MDRNGLSYFYIIKVTGSLSVRRAWIEMHMCHTIDRERAVALRKESVDRNVGTSSTVDSCSGRSP